MTRARFEQRTRGPLLFVTQASCATIEAETPDSCWRSSLIGACAYQVNFHKSLPVQVCGKWLTQVVGLKSPLLYRLSYAFSSPQAVDLQGR